MTVSAASRGIAYGTKGLRPNAELEALGVDRGRQLALAGSIWMAIALGLHQFLGSNQA